MYRVIKASEEEKFWSMDVEGEDDIINEIWKAANAGTTLEDVIDYLDTLEESYLVDPTIRTKIQKEVEQWF